MTAARSEPITDSELAAIVEWEQTPCWNADGWRMSIVLERDNGHAKGAVVATTELRNAALAARELQVLRAATKAEVDRNTLNVDDIGLTCRSCWQRVAECFCWLQPFRVLLPEREP
jgi:hypothetical protein